MNDEHEILMEEFIKKIVDETEDATILFDYKDFNLDFPILQFLNLLNQ
jgi:hypothetical protein